jgi:hypothetical protein
MRIIGCGSVKGVTLHYLAGLKILGPGLNRSMPPPLHAGSKKFRFRDLEAKVLIGTASDRYAGWIGQIYSGRRYEKGISRQGHKVGDQTFHEETLPAESVTEYFEHFPLLEIDYTFHRPLLEALETPPRMLMSFDAIGST